MIYIHLGKGQNHMPPEVILENEKMIYKMSQKFYGVEKEDIVQAGFLGLTKAYRSYDPSKSKAKFTTYAYGFIYGEMYEAATGNRPIRVRKPEMKLYKGVVKTKALLEEKHGREVPYEEVCNFLHVDYELFLSILNSLSALVSIDASFDTLTKPDNTETMIMLKESMEALTPIERQVIKERYLKDKSQEETAKTLGLSQVKVSRIERQTKEKIRNYV